MPRTRHVPRPDPTMTAPVVLTLLLVAAVVGPRTRTAPSRGVTMPSTERLPHSLGKHPKPGDRYSPPDGEHAGHVIEFVSAEGVGHIDCCPGPSYRAHLVRCLDCLQSWTFGDPWSD